MKPRAALALLSLALLLAPARLAAEEAERPVTCEARFADKRFLVQVTAPHLPDGTFFYVHACFGGQPFARTKGTIQAGSFQVTLGPFEQEFWSGEYEIRLFLLPGRQLPKVTAGATEDLPPLRHRTVLRVGTEEQERAEEQERHAYYAAAVERGLGLLDELVEAYGATSKSLFVDPEQKAVGPDAWREWLEFRGLLAADKRTARDQVKRWTEDQRFLNENGRLQTEKWQSWMEDFRARIEEALVAHRTYLSQHVAPRYPRAAIDVEALYSGTFTLSRKYSINLYGGNRLPVPSWERRASVELTNPPPGSSIVHVRQLARAIKREVGLDSK
jgi:hypothetical protein